MYAALKRTELFQEVRVERSGAGGSVIITAKVPHGQAGVEDGERTVR